MRLEFSAAIVAATFAIGGSAGASTLYPGGFGGPGGNACTDVNTCVFDDGTNPATPAIAKFNFDDSTNDGDPASYVFELEATNNSFATVDGLEFTFSGYTGGEVTSIMFDYTPAAGDPLLTMVAVKAATGGKLFTLFDSDFTFDGTTFSGTLNSTGLCTPGPRCNTPGISNITFFDTGPTSVIPLPASALLLMGGVGGLGALRLRRKG